MECGNDLLNDVKHLVLRIGIQILELFQLSCGQYFIDLEPYFLPNTIELLGFRSLRSCEVLLHELQELTKLLRMVQM